MGKRVWRACHSQNWFRRLVTRKMVLEGLSPANGFRGLVTREGVLEGFSQRKMVLEGDHRYSSNIQTKISRNTIYFGRVVSC